ncbi:MAG: hypothetical protein RMN24_07820, partial [Anaerolineae bacterium]|nr:hypothetical protein [Caldilineales bacterium]MDW8269056.1 hypothetical protein [Anaerolineae bacterium]
MTTDRGARFWRRPGAGAEGRRRFIPVFILVGLGAFIALLNPTFLTPSNLITVVLQASILSIVAIGQTYVILTAGIDLSVGSLVALGGALSAGLAVKAG